VTGDRRPEIRDPSEGASAPVSGLRSPISSREGQTFGGTSTLLAWLNFVKLPHTLFALPFALLGVLAASQVAPVTPRVVWWVVVAFTAARFAAMGFNRIADRAFDARNPRTAGREIPTGRISVVAASAAVVLAAVIFVIASAMLNPLCLILSPLALGWILGYSYAKRFTSWPHLWLGLSLAIAPVGGWLAVTGAWSDPWWLLLTITLAVMTWVAGFDMFYALPDAGFDRSQGLRSAVVRLGERRAILVAKLLHGITIPALVLFGWGAGFGVWYFIGIALAALILVWEHRLVRPGDLSRLDAAFFTMNGVMSVTVCVFALIDTILSS
jgi:4-hydroxybenzoate polyprenyltransferase